MEKAESLREIALDVSPQMANFGLLAEGPKCREPHGKPPLRQKMITFLREIPKRQKRNSLQMDTTTLHNVAPQGRGIFLTREMPSQIDMSTPLVAQRYIARPLLLDGFKFDLRLYVLVTGCDPLRIFLHEQGLVRLASQQYVAPKKKNPNWGVSLRLVSVHILLGNGHSPRAHILAVTMAGPFCRGVCVRRRIDLCPLRLRVQH